MTFEGAKLSGVIWRVEGAKPGAVSSTLLIWDE